MIFIDDEKSLRSMYERGIGNNIRHIREIHHESPVSDAFFDNVTRNDNGIYPNNIYSIMILNENYPTGSVKIRKNFG